MKPQLRKCNNCNTVWKTHEQDGTLYKCPNCNSSRKDHKIFKKEDNVFSRHLITINDYDNILLNRTWHDAFGHLVGNSLVK